MLNGIIVAVHTLQEHALGRAQKGSLPLSDHGGLVKPVNPIHQEEPDRLAEGRRAHGDDRGGERLAPLIQGGYAEKVERTGFQPSQAQTGTGRRDAVVKGTAIGTMVDLVPGSCVTDHAIAATGRRPGERHLARSGVANRQPLWWLGQQVDWPALPAGLVFDDPLKNGTGRDLAENGLPQVAGVAGNLRVVKGNLQQHAGDAIQFAQFTPVGALLVAVDPGGIPGGPQVGD